VAAFHRQYRRVRERDGHGARPVDACRALPFVAGGSDGASEWRIRQESFSSLIELLASQGWRSARILDAGAGTGWLSNQLAAREHRPVAVDRYDDRDDGLGACAVYQSAFPAVQADFNALPFAAAQFDAVVFNASLHYSPDVDRTIAEAARVLAACGLLVVMDSPMFECEHDGEAMLRGQTERLRTEFDEQMPILPGVGFLTRDSLATAARVRGWQERFVPSSGPMSWRLRRWWGSRRLDRAPATFGMWVAQ
jgi:SAM-dependent methyltransferase